MKHCPKILKYINFILAALFLIGASALTLAQTQLQIQNDGLTLSAFASSDKTVLSTTMRVVGPNGVVFDDRIEDSAIQWIPEGNLPDGVYKWEVRTVTAESNAPTREIVATVARQDSKQSVASGSKIDQTVQSDREKNAQAGARREIPIERYFEDEYKSVTTESGSFRVRDGWMEALQPDGEISYEQDAVSIGAAGEPGVLGSIAGAVMDFLFPSAHAQCSSPCDVDGVGDAEVHLNADTNASSGGPWEWELEVDQTTGQFRIGEEGLSSEPFRIDWNAPSNSLYVEGTTGDIGLGTSTPTQPLHIVDAFPRIRIEDSTDAQSWYIKNVNSGTFEIGESPGGGGAFLIQPGAPASALGISSNGSVGINTGTSTHSLVVENSGDDTVRLIGPGVFGSGSRLNFGVANFVFIDEPADDRLQLRAVRSTVISGGNVGIGTDPLADPEETLHIRRTNGTAGVLLEETSSVPTNSMLTMRNNGNPGFLMENSDSGVAWQFRLGGSGNTEQFTINKTSIPGPELSILASGDIRIKGSYISSSSRTNKDNIVKIDERNILERVTQMPIYEWSYKNSPGSRHIGPMAEEYHDVFGLAGGGKGLAGTDMAGLALASVKALSTEAMDLSTEVHDLSTEVEDLKKQNQILRSRSEKFDEMLERIAVLESRLTALAGYAQVE